MTNSSIKSEIKKYVAYYRVSTKMQGDSGLGLDSQKSQVIKAIGDNELIASFTEVESGKKDNRKELAKAIELAKKENAILIIAKLDRLSRDAEFLFNLNKQKIEIQACDIANFNTLTLGIYATIAQHERETISKRTKDALQAAKARGVKLGSPTSKETIANAQKLAAEASHERALSNENNIKAKSLITIMRNGGSKWNDIVIELNKNGFKTSTGGTFGLTQAQRLYK